MIDEAMARRMQAIPAGKNDRGISGAGPPISAARQRLIEAKDIYMGLILQDPANAEAASRMGILAASMGLATFALELLKKAVALQPGEPAHQANLGEVLRRQGRVKEAEAALRSALSTGRRTIRRF